MSVRRVSPHEAHTLCEQGYTYVDVRSEQEFAAGHPSGSVNVPLLHLGPAGMTPNPDFMAVMIAAFPRDAKLVIGCKAGGRSLRAATAMVGQGYTDVIDQRAGFVAGRGPDGQPEEGWGSVGLPVGRGDGGESSYAAVRTRALQ